MANDLPPLSTEARNLSVGRYRHYKGGEYQVLGVSRHSETLEELVVYRAEYGNKQLWVRPLEMFIESVQVEGVDRPRFSYLD